jgi:hypothetical protein
MVRERDCALETVANIAVCVKGVSVERPRWTTMDPTKEVRRLTQMEAPVPSCRNESTSQLQN